MSRWTRRATGLVAALTLGVATMMTSIGSTFAFERIATGGLGDAGNNYAHSMTFLNNCLIVGSTRHWAFFVGIGLLGGGGAGVLPITSPPGGEIPPTSNLAVAEDWAGSIFRKCKGQDWEVVYTSPVVPVGGGLFSPAIHGFRSGNTYTAIHNGVSKTAAYHGGGFSFPPALGHLLVRSFTGNPGDWEVVPTPLSMGTDATTIEVFKGRLCVASTGLDFNPPLGFPVPSPAAMVHCTKKIDPATGKYAHPTSPGDWELVANVTTSGLAQAPGAAINFSAFSLKPWGDHFYVGTAVFPNPATGNSGFQVWKCGLGIIPFNCTPIILHGGGDMRNAIAAELDVHKGHVYVGVFNLPTSLEEFTDPKPAELFRIDKNDKWELVVGDCVAKSPAPDGSGDNRFPISGIPAGFGNLFNVYTTALESHNRLLYVGTFDLTSFFPFIPEAPSRLPINFGGCLGTGPLTTFLNAVAIRIKPGGDIWTSFDGTHWWPQTFDGLGNPTNMWPRTIKSFGKRFRRTLFVGFANPFDGFDVFRKGRLP